ncbi:MAG TPA: LysR family transcriptional regulator substrate-binding protein, partial [Bryobacteraceae bacterium]
VNVHHDEIRLIVPAGHLLASKRSVAAEDLLDEQLLLPKEGKTRARLNDWLDLVSDQVQVSMELDSTEMMKRFVAAGLGLSFLAVSNCLEEIAAGKLRAVPLAPEPMIRKLGLIYRKDKALSKAALGFIHVVQANIVPEIMTSEARKLPRVVVG